MRTVKYRDYQASVEYDDGKLFVKVLHIDDLLIGECDSASEAEGVLKELIDEYLLDCTEVGKEPCKPFKGSLNIRVTPELHRRAAVSAADVGMTLNSWIGVAIAEKVECSKLSDRIDGVFSKQQEITTRAFLQYAHHTREDHLSEQLKLRVGIMRYNDDPKEIPANTTRKMWHFASPLNG